MNAAKTLWVTGRLVGLAAAGLVLLSAPTPARAQQEANEKTWRVPIVMEQATVRGRVVILESRREDRKTVGGLRIEVWSTDPDDPNARDSRLHRTRTDDDGLFELPLLDLGRYLMIIGDLRLSLQVVEQSANRRGQQEPKVLLILLPKDVV